MTDQQRIFATRGETADCVAFFERICGRIITGISRDFTMAVSTVLVPVKGQIAPHRYDKQYQLTVGKALFDTPLQLRLMYDTTGNGMNVTLYRETMITQGTLMRYWELLLKPDGSCIIRCLNPYYGANQAVLQFRVTDPFVNGRSGNDSPYDLVEHILEAFNSDK